MLAEDCDHRSLKTQERFEGRGPACCKEVSDDGCKHPRRDINIAAEIHNKSREKLKRDKSFVVSRPAVAVEKEEKEGRVETPQKENSRNRFAYHNLRGQYTADTSYTKAAPAAARGEEESWSYQPFLRANRLLSSASTLGTLNCTYSRSRSSWLSFCISSRSSSLRSNSRRPRFRPVVSQSLRFKLESWERMLTLIVERDDEGAR